MKKLEPTAFRENVTHTLERFDPEAEDIKKDDVKLYEYLIGNALLHERASCLYKEVLTKIHFASDGKRTYACDKPPASGKRKHE